MLCLISERYAPELSFYENKNRHAFELLDIQAERRCLNIKYTEDKYIYKSCRHFPAVVIVKDNLLL